MLTATELHGNFHAHITLNTSQVGFAVPCGWKTTIILLNKGDREQKDTMITKHFRTDTEKTKNVEAIMEVLRNTALELAQDVNIQVVRVKLEHESLPTLNITEHSYREAHIKIQVPYGKDVNTNQLTNYVRSRNPMAVTPDGLITFLNVRFYAGTVSDVDQQINDDVILLQKCNPHIKVLEVKIESAIYDTNLLLDRWWA
jgi:hypothetical protein